MDKLNALFDNDSETEATLPAGPSTVSWHFPQAREVTMLTLTSGATSAAPSDWQLEASSDGEHWHRLDTRKNETFSSPHQTRVFGIRQPGRYAFYRLSFPSTHGAARALAEIELIGSTNTKDQ